MYGSWDPPGARLLDAVAVMDRLYSPGGDPWKRPADPRVAGPVPAGGVLRGVRRDRGRRPGRAARGARRRAAPGGPARPAGRGPARGRALVGRRRGRRPGGQDDPPQPARVRRRPTVGSVDEIIDNWEQIKRAEKARDSALDGIALAQPALALAAQVPAQRAERAGSTCRCPTGDDLGARLLRGRRRPRSRRDAEAALRRAALPTPTPYGRRADAGLSAMPVPGPVR